MATTQPSAPPLGSFVSVPGAMHGTLKFVGSVAGKKGIFAGVQLAPEYAARGKNSGDVEGRHYFRTTVPGAGIFLPIEKAIKMDTGPTPSAGGMATPIGGKSMAAPPTTPKTPGALGSFNQGGRTPAASMNTLGNLPKPSFSQSIGPGARPGSSASRGRRESMPRPTSPLRKVQNNTSSMGTPGAGAAGKLNTPKTRPSLGFGRTVGTGGPPTAGSRYGVASPAGRVSTAGGNKFSQSLRQIMVTPNRISKREASPLGPEAIFDEEPEESQVPTPTPAALTAKDSADNEAYEREISRLKQSLDDRDRHLKDQAASINEMERSLAELQKLIPDAQDQDAQQTVRKASREATADDDLGTDMQSLRQALREKNEKIKALTAEFDANRADFRSTIDTLEMASSETERVYEKRVDELLEEVRGLQDRSEDVEGVARQFRQLEELVQELEEGLEDARRGESEAKAENEFLRGEVERLRSEMKKLKEAQVESARRDTEKTLSGEDSDPQLEDFRQQLDQKEDEVRGLKAIIIEMNRKSTSTDRSSMPNGESNVHTSRQSEELEVQIRDLKELLSKKSDRADELENEVSRLRSNSYSRFPKPAHNQSSVSEKHTSDGSHGQSDRTVTPDPQQRHDFLPANAVRPFHSRGHSQTNSQPKTLGAVDEDSMDEDTPHSHQGDLEDDAIRSQSRLTDASSTALWCEICEESGHDILTCRNMFGASYPEPGDEARRHKGPERDRPAPLRTSSKTDVSTAATSNMTSRPSSFVPGPAPLMPPPTPTMGPPRGHHKSSSQATVIASPSSSHNNAKPPPTDPAPIHREPDSIADSLSSPASSSEPANLAGMVAGKKSGVIDPDRWCALCERDGHESVDCPDEEAF